MKRIILAFVIVLMGSPAFAQSDCPTKHAALTLLDHASMEAAVRASFVGIYHREPSGVPGSGPDDIGWWITTFDHYGEYSDHICRAGWNAYAEARLSGVDVGLTAALGDQPARFQPVTAPVVVPPPPVVTVPTPPAPPVPLPLPAFDYSLLLAKLDAIDAHINAVDVKFDAYEQNPPWLKKFFTNPAVLGIMSTVTAFAGCRAAGKC